MTTQQTKAVDFEGALEAFNEDGRVVPAHVIWARSPDNEGDFWLALVGEDSLFCAGTDDDRISPMADGWRIRNVPANPQAPTPSPELTARMVAQPGYVPPHKLPGWLSSEDVKAEIMKLAEAGADKAVCWDMMQAVYRLADASRALAEAGK